MTQSLTHKGTLQKCLNEYYNEHTIDDTYKCEECSKSSKAKKSHQIIKLPQVTVYHIKRFNDNLEKITKDTKYPPSLSLEE